MPELFGRELTAGEIRERTGDISQVAGARVIELADGPERSVRAVDVRTGSGLRFLVAADRGMDIADASYRGVPLAWISPTGVTHPAHYEEPGLGWLRSFHGGLLVTCGPTYLGEPCTDEGVELGLHGRASNTPAREVSVRQDWDDAGEEYAISVSGRVREASVFGPNVELFRTIRTRLGSSTVSVSDRVTNLGWEPAPLMVLYHMNFGWPLVDERAELLLPPCEDVPRDEDARAGLDRARMFEKPTPGSREKVYSRDVPADETGFAHVGVVNRALRPPLGVAVSFRKRELPRLIQWKMMGRGTYVCGIEPANCLVEGRAKERERGTLEFLQPGEAREFELSVSVLDSEEAIGAFERRLRACV